MDAGPVTHLLQELERGDPTAVDRLTPLVYGELRQLAGRLMQGERQGHTLQPTALVHEAYLRLVGQRDVAWSGRAHFMALAARLMRRVLVDHARRRGRQKRGGSAIAVTLRDDLVGSDPPPLDLLALEDALVALSEEDERAARVVELRFFGGLDCGEIGDLLGVSAPTVKRDWRFARAWLERTLTPGDAVP